MKREAEAAVLDLCERQLAVFDEHAWRPLAGVSSAELAAVALFLAGGAGQGRRVELERVAERLHPGSVGRLSALVASTDFDPARFDAMLKARLWHARAS